MKILLFTLEYPPFKGGVAHYYSNLIDNWPEGDEVFVLTDKSNGDSCYSKDNNVCCTALLYRFLPLFKWLPAIFKLYKEIKTKKINHIIVGQILPLGTVVLIASYFLKFKYSVVIHGMDFEYALKTYRKRNLAYKILRKAENIICNSSYGRNAIVREMPELSEKIGTVNPGIDIRTTYNARSSSLVGKRITHIRKKYNFENRIILFSVGRLVKRKGFDKVIEIMPEVLKEVPDLIYVIAGAGPDEEYLKDLASRENHPQPLLEKEGNILFLDKISDEEKWAWFRECDIFVMPARNIDGDVEGFGIVYLEANLAGRPVIAGDSGGVRDAVENGINGLLVDPENNNDIKNGIIKLAKDEGFREKLGRQGKERVINEFNWEKLAIKFYNIINK